MPSSSVVRPADPYCPLRLIMLFLCMPNISQIEGPFFLIGACVLFPPAKRLDRYPQEVSNNLQNSIAKSISIVSVRLSLRLVTCALPSTLGRVILSGLASNIINDYEQSKPKLNLGSLYTSNEFVTSLVISTVLFDVPVDPIVVALYDSVLSPLIATAFNYVNRIFSTHNEAPAPDSIAAGPN